MDYLCGEEMNMRWYWFVVVSTLLLACGSSNTKKRDGADMDTPREAASEARVDSAAGAGSLADTISGDRASVGNAESADSTAGESSDHYVIKYSEAELENFLDSIARLNPKTWTKRLTFPLDSVLWRKPVPLDVRLRASDFDSLKAGCERGALDYKFAKRIFPDLSIDSADLKDLLGFLRAKENEIPIGFYPFTKSKFGKFAVSVGYDQGGFWDNDVYFFVGNKIISKHNVEHHYGLELKGFWDEKGSLVVYYNVNYASGTGVSWYQNNFYRFENRRLVPMFHELKSAYLDPSWGSRPIEVKSEVVGTAPLAIKFVFKTDLRCDWEDPLQEFVNDSIVVRYRYDSQKKTYRRVFSDKKWNEYKMMSYYLEASQNLFVNAYARELRAYLHSGDKEKRDLVLCYLSKVKEYVN